MSDERYNALMDALFADGEEGPLTPDEVAAGWHFCYGGWDGLLIGPGMKEYKFCECGPETKI